MQVTSKIVKIKKVDSPTTEYIESEFTKLNITPLRWAIVGVSDTMYVVDVAILKG